MKLTNEEKRYAKWLDAVKIDHNALLDVPKELWTDELCLEAVKTDYSILHYLPKERLTKEICIMAYQSILIKCNNKETNVNYINTTIFSLFSSGNV